MINLLPRISTEHKEIIMGLTTLYDMSKDSGENTLIQGAKMVACYRAMTTGENLNKWISVYQQNIKVAAELLKKYKALFKGGYLSNCQVFAILNEVKDSDLYKKFAKEKVNLIDSTIGQHTFRVIRYDIEASLRMEHGHIIFFMRYFSAAEKIHSYPKFHLETKKFEKNLEKYFNDNAESKEIVELLGRENAERFLNHWYEFQKTLHVSCFAAVNLKPPEKISGRVNIYPKIFENHQQKKQKIISVTCPLAYLHARKEYELTPMQIESLSEKTASEKQALGEKVITFYQNISSSEFPREFESLVKKKTAEQKTSYSQYKKIIKYGCQYDKEDEKILLKMYKYISEKYGEDVKKLLYVFIETPDLTDLDTEMGLEYTKKFLRKKIGEAQVATVLELMQNMEHELEEKCKKKDETTNRLVSARLLPM